jgi:ABC-type transport system involved in multi-copper enzyme maturation permease subunit
MKLVHLTMVEMRRALHRRLVWWMIALALAGIVFVGFVVYVSSDDPLELARSSDHPAFMRNWWIHDSDEGFLLLAAIFLALGGAICGASVAGAEWRAGTITTVLTWEPARVRLQAARSLSAAILSFVIATILQIVFLASALPAVWAHGNSTGTDGEFWRELAYAMVRISFVTALIAVVALSIATIGRNTVAALVAISAWALIGEGLIRGYRPGLARWLITENVATVIPWRPLDSAEFQRGPGVALATLLLYLAIFAVIATISFTRRDIAGGS